MLYPKPKWKKKKKVHKASILQQRDGSCYLCKMLYTKPIGPIEEHHIFFGSPNRELSEKYGLKVYLCRNHHTGRDGVHTWPDGLCNEMLHQEGQRAFEETHSREEFRDIFGRSWL